MNRAKHAKQNKSQNFNEAIEQLLSPGPSFIESPANLEGIKNSINFIINVKKYVVDNDYVSIEQTESG